MPWRRKNPLKKPLRPTAGEGFRGGFWEFSKNLSGRMKAAEAEGPAAFYPHPLPFPLTLDKLPTV